ncbi:phosphatase PAP2 family protein [Modestobacter versicolor]|uniref:Undecaprenyl-diphosphatase n=1 Tax=Modestobacter versicolor TaxID=429133 RepID=A0A839Y7U7_9ACTN|nr:phosphatase PAP2 family protein [Modestobacter versicolor]MBB3675803.1 undecaprenyl-diphosphatase [Modestobacter versicolor]
MHTAHPGQPDTLAVPAARSTARVLTAVAGAALLLVVLGGAVAAGWAPLLRVDGAVRDALYAGDDRSGLVESVLQVATAPGLSVSRGVVLLPVLVWLVLRRSWWTATWVLGAAGLVSPLTGALKELVGRQRPQFADGGARYDSLSFPSGHSSGVAALVTVALVLAWPLLAPAARRWWLAAGAALVLLVGLTRMWLGVHFLSDVLGGWALGLGWTLLVALAFGALPGGRAALRPGPAT